MPGPSLFIEPTREEGLSTRWAGLGRGAPTGRPLRPPADLAGGSAENLAHQDPDL